MGDIRERLVQADGSRIIELWEEDGGMHIVVSDDGAWEPEWGCVDLSIEQVRELSDFLIGWLKPRG